MPLTSEQFNELVEQYAEIVLDRMDIGTMEQWIFDELCDRYNDMSETELRDYMVEIEDSGWAMRDFPPDQERKGGTGEQLG